MEVYGSMDDEKELFEDEQDDLESDNERSSDDTDESENSQDDKRYNDLMSKWQKAEAKANRLESELARRAEERESDTEEPATKKEKYSVKDDPEVQSLKRVLLDEARSAIYRSDPRLTKYGIDVTDLTGDSPEEIRESLTRQVNFIERMESRITEDVLSQHGLAPEIGGSAVADPVDVSKMSSEEFEKYIEDAINR